MTKINYKFIVKIALILFSILLILYLTILVNAIFDIINGNIKVSLSSDGKEYISTNMSEYLLGKENKSSLIEIPAQIFITENGEMLNQVTVNCVKIIGLMYIFPQISFMVLLILVCINIFRSEIFTQINARLLLLASIILLISAVALPLLMTQIIPTIVTAASDNNLDVGFDNTVVMKLSIFGLGAIIQSFIVKIGAEMQQRNSD